MSIFFSVVIPTYNRAGFIQKTLNSLFNQTFENFEIIVVDDGSSDNTEEVLRTISDHRFTYFKKENGERGAARNYGAQLAKGDYINFFDSDDLAYPNHLEIAYRFIQANNSPEVLHLGYDFKTPEGAVQKIINQLPSPLNNHLIYGNHLSCNGVFLRRDIALNHPFSEKRELSASEDYALWLCLAARYPILSFSNVTSSVINHEARSVFTINVESIKRRLELLRDELLSDQEFMKIYGEKWKYFDASLDLYLSLHLAMAGERQKALALFFQALSKKPTYLFSRKAAGLLKNLLK